MSEKPVPWEDGPAKVGPLSLDEWNGQAGPGVLDISGLCPRCGHQTTSNVHQVAVVVTATAAADAPGVDAQDAFNAATLFKCQCGQEHAHPKDMVVTGCGAYWVARPVKNPNEDLYGLEPVEEPQLVAAATLVGKESVTAEGGLKTLAEKWIPGIAAILGVLGLAGLVVSKDTVAGLSQEWRGAAFALVAASVSAAIIATVLVYRAAFGWPAEVTLGTDEDVLAAAEKLSGKNRAIARHLRTAVVWSVLAVAALLAALAVFWLQPDSTRPIKVTFSIDGTETTMCGKPGKIVDGELQIKVTDGSTTQTERVPLSAVTILEQVATCGG